MWIELEKEFPLIPELNDYIKVKVKVKNETTFAFYTKRHGWRGEFFEEIKPSYWWKD